MIPVKSNTIVYILCAPNFATGGPEALHQLGHHLIKLGITAKMFYYPKRQSPVHPFYIKYHVPYVFNIDNSTDNYLILPETSTSLLYEKKFNKTKKIIWWLSVTNYYKILASLIEKTKKNYYWFKKLYNPIKFATLDNIKESGALNLAHSYFSINHLKENGINLVGQISDYISTSFFKTAEQNVDKKNLIIYNPVKNGAFLNEIIAQTPDLKWVPIQGLDPDNVAGIMSSAKLYVDFGYHPGKERMPREACIMGCCLIIGKDGSAKFKQDMPIPEQFRFEKQDNQIPQIIKTIRLCLEDYPHQSKLFSDYRNKLYDEEKVFEKDIQKTFVKI